MASFQAKIDWKRQRKRKKNLSFGFVPTRPVIESSRKLAKKKSKT